MGDMMIAIAFLDIETKYPAYKEDISQKDAEKTIYSVNSYQEV